MKIKAIAAALLTAASFSAMAADQTVQLNTTDLAHFTGTPAVLQGGDDLITFTGLAAGTYNIFVTLSSQNITWNAAQSVLSNGTNSVSGILSGSKLQYLDFDYTGTGPFTLLLVGTPSGSKFGYSGEVTVSPVPEPATYGMMLGGLALVGALARRKAKKSA